MTVESFSYSGEGIQNVYQNDKWLIAIKNWREANDISHISRLEIHFKTDEQFVLLAGSGAFYVSRLHFQYALTRTGDFPGEMMCS